MKRLFLFVFTCLLLVGCTKHTTKYSNGDVDKYTYKNGILEITMPNGDKTDGKLTVSFQKDMMNRFYAFDRLKNWKKANKNKSDVDGIVRYIKETAIDANYKLVANPVSTKFQDSHGLLSIDDDGKIFLFYDVIALNGFGVPGKVNFSISLGLHDSEPEYFGF